MRYMVFILFFILLASPFCKAQQDEEKDAFFRVNGMFNTFDNQFKSYGVQSNLDLEIIIPKTPLFIGFGSSVYLAFKPDKMYTLKDRSVSDWSTLIAEQVYLGGLPLNTEHHRIALSGGYALATYVHVPEMADKVYSDQGFLVRASYDYIFDAGFSIGAIVQYTNYLKRNTTPDLLSIGISVGFGL